MTTSMNPLDLVTLSALMARGSGSAEVRIGLVDGPVDVGHPDLMTESIRDVPGSKGAGCRDASSAACFHGTFVAGILSARRGSPAPAICPACVLLVRPVFTELTPAAGQRVPRATPKVVAEAIVDC